MHSSVLKRFDHYLRFMVAGKETEVLVTLPSCGFFSAKPLLRNCKVTSYLTL